MSDIICPYCGEGRDAEYEDYGRDGEENTEECDKCGKEFITTISISHDWNSMCTKENHKDDGEHRLGHIWCEYCNEIIGKDDSPKAAGWPDGQVI